MKGQRLAILLRMQRHEPIDKWWKRSEFEGTKGVRADLEALVQERFLERMTREMRLGGDAEHGRKVEVVFYRLAPRYREGNTELPVGVGV